MAEKGFGAILVIIAVVLVLSTAVFLASKPTSKTQEKLQTQIQNADEPPLKLKSIGVNFEDFEFTKNKLAMDRIWMDYGFVIPANMSATGRDKPNPQPTFLLPMGTKVYSLVDGVVVGVPKLYSGDYSIQVAKDNNSRWRYETEHVANVVVKEGDVVKAGQVVAEVSPHDSEHNNGFGLVEIGILKGGGEGPPEHICPFAYLDSSIKEDVQKKIIAFYKSWEEYRGDQTLYPENYQIPGCLTLDPIEG